MNWTTWNRHLYAAWAPFYDVLVSMLEEKRKQSIRLAAIQPNEDVLLFGAGTGLDLEHLPRNLRTTAIDITPAMIRRLRQRADRLNMDVDARVMDGQKLDFTDAAFDVVILHFVLAVIPDPARALNEAIRVLRPGGRLVILNKFLNDARQPSLTLKCANTIARVVATDITFKLRPIIDNPSLTTRHVEEAGLGGFFKIAILEKLPEHAIAKQVSVSPAAMPSPTEMQSPAKHIIPKPAKTQIRDGQLISEMSA